jgi:hypothetical protein
MQNMELVRTFRKFGVTLRLYEMAYSLSEGKTRCAYELKHGRKVIFEGKEFYTGAGFTADSMRSVECLLGFLTLQIGDTDREYFDNYTKAQFEFINSDTADNLRLWLYERENKG